MESIMTGTVSFSVQNANFTVKYKAWLNEAGEMITCEDVDFLEMGFDPYDTPQLESLYTRAFLEAVDEDINIQQQDKEDNLYADMVIP